MGQGNELWPCGALLQLQTTAPLSQHTPGFGCRLPLTGLEVMHLSVSLLRFGKDRVPSTSGALMPQAGGQPPPRHKASASPERDVMLLICHWLEAEHGPGKVLSGSTGSAGNVGKRGLARVKRERKAQHLWRQKERRMKTATAVQVCLQVSWFWLWSVTLIV